MRRRFAVFEISFVAMTFMIVVRPFFLFDVEQGLDSWFSFGVSNLLAEYPDYELFLYRSERLPVFFYRVLIYSQLPLTWAKYILGYFLHFMMLWSFSLVSRQLFKDNSTILLLLILAFHPLVFGSLHNDYIAIDVTIWMMLTLAAALNIPNRRGKDLWLWSILTGFLWGLTLFSHLKIGIYAVFVPMLIFFDWRNFRIKPAWLNSSMGFALGFLSCMACLSVTFRWLILDRYFFFYQQWRMAFFVPSEPYNRPFVEALENTPCVEMMALATTLMFYSWKIPQSRTIASLVLGNLVFVVIYGLAGGTIFVESNYIWLVPSLMLAIGITLDKTPQHQLLKSAVALIPLGLSLHLISGQSLHNRIFHLMEFKILFFALGFAFLLVGLFHWFNKKSQKAAAGFILFTLIFFNFALRPDFLYGSSLYDPKIKNSTQPIVVKQYFTNMQSFFRQIAQWQLPKVPLIVTNTFEDDFLRIIAWSYIQGMYRVDGVPQTNVGLEHYEDFYYDGAFWVYASRAPKVHKLMNHIKTLGFDSKVIKIEPFQADPEMRLVGLQLKKSQP